ncbi:TonB family protein [Lysobacter ciconiae]|uniref:TonB family protein n=1 Tax=Novilysobacter ciconiae TaxID=2781022 RepID=A0A7S6ZTE3_9GAMM|nr:energy transducer TonB [Lysobacter ciconiae]QOW20614.1 TonB family protein [Lysobacter ciconiae]
MPATSRPRFDPARWLPTQRMWWVVIFAAAAGLLLFAIIWARSRSEPDFYRPGEAPADAVAADYTPLPVPTGDGTGERIEVPAESAAAQTQSPAFIEPEPAQVVESAPSFDPGPAPVYAPASNSPIVPPVPLAGQTPAPRYPARANRRGESGTVMVEAMIGADGVPTAVRVARRSGSNDLDRAAVEAVRRWRFQPATQDGRPTTGVVNVPVSFQPGG